MYRCLLNHFSLLPFFFFIFSYFIPTLIFPLYTAPLKVTITPIRVTANIGETVTFNCSHKGHPWGEPHWYHNTVKLSKSSRVRILPDGGLIISNIQRSDKGEYQCIVTNDYESAQNSTFLNLSG